MALLVDDNLKADIEAYCGQKFDLKTWANIRQCVRCFTKGKRIKNRQLVDHPATESESVVRQILRDLGKKSREQNRPFHEVILESVTVS